MSVMSTAEQVQGSNSADIRRGKPKRQADLRVVEGIQVDHSRDALLTEFGKKTLEDRYLLPGETFQGMFARVATAYADDADHAQRIYDCDTCSFEWWR